LRYSFEPSVEQFTILGVIAAFLSLALNKIIMVICSLGFAPKISSTRMPRVYLYLTLQPRQVSYFAVVIDWWTRTTKISYLLLASTYSATTYLNRDF